MKVKISDILVSDRIRKDLGNIEALSTSMSRHGLFSPILITSDYRLIAGERRLEAAKRLGWKSIEARVIDDPGEIGSLELEIEENIYRKPFTDEELDEGYARIRRLQNPSLKERIKRFFKRIFDFLFRRNRKNGHPANKAVD